MATVHCSIHRLPLQLETVQDSYKCSSCKVKSFGERYKWPHEDCDYRIHEVCKDPPQRIEHSFFENIVFDFKDATVGRRSCLCDACGLDIEGCFYYSSCGSGSGCSFYGTGKCRGHDLHTHCARTLLPNQEIANDNDVRLLLKKKLSAECGFCRHITARTVRDRKVKSWGYVSEDEEHQFHIYCFKKKLIDNWETMTFRDESTLLRYEMNQSQIETRNGNNRKRGRSSRFKRRLKVVVSLIVSVLLGNPTPLFVCMSTYGHGKSSARVLKVINPLDQSQIEPRDSHVSKNRRRRRAGWVFTLLQLIVVFGFAYLCL